MEKCNYLFLLTLVDIDATVAGSGRIRYLSEPEEKAYQGGWLWLYSLGDRIAGFLLTRINIIAPKTKKSVKKMME